jgi:hypothetical protein
MKPVPMAYQEWSVIMQQLPVLKLSWHDGWWQCGITFMPLLCMLITQMYALP